jgi:glutamate/aspartate transport system permease protein
MSYNWNWSVLLQPVATGEGGVYLDWVFNGVGVTLMLTASAWLLALAIGSVLGVVRCWPGRLGSWVGAAYVSVFRNIPLIVQFFFWMFVVPEILPAPAGTWIKSVTPSVQFFGVSVVALSLFTAARICEQVRAGITAVGPAQMNAALAVGFSTLQAFLYVLLPQAFRRILPALTSEFLIISKNSAVASTIGLLELSGEARQLVDYTAQPYESFIAVTLGYLLLNFCLLAIARAFGRWLAAPGLMGA